MGSCLTSHRKSNHKVNNSKKGKHGVLPHMKHNSITEDSNEENFDSHAWLESDSDDFFSVHSEFSVSGGSLSLRQSSTIKVPFKPSSNSIHESFRKEETMLIELLDDGSSKIFDNLYDDERAFDGQDKFSKREKIDLVLEDLENSLGSDQVIMLDHNNLPKTWPVANHTFKPKPINLDFPPKTTSRNQGSLGSKSFRMPDSKIGTGKTTMADMLYS